MYKSEEGYVVESKIQIHHVVSKNQGMVESIIQIHHVDFKNIDMVSIKNQI